jgi:hypothetical protein
LSHQGIKVDSDNYFADFEVVEDSKPQKDINVITPLDARSPAKWDTTFDSVKRNFVVLFDDFSMVALPGTLLRGTPL